MKYSKSDTQKAMLFKESELAKYVDYSYQQVADLKSKERLLIASPRGLEHFNFAMEVNDNDDGGLELSVFYYDLPPYGDVPSWAKELPGIGEISLGESKFRLWFDIYIDGRKEWPSFEHLDGED